MEELPVDGGGGDGGYLSVRWGLDGMCSFLKVHEHPKIGWKCANNLGRRGSEA